MKGFTLLETIMGLFIIVVIMTMFLGAFSSFRESNDLQTAHSTIIGTLKDARGRALASENNNTYGVHFEASKAVLFRGSAYNSSDASNEPYILPPTAKISTISLTGGAVDTIFSRLGGTTTASGSVTISSKNTSARIKTITITTTGNVQ